MSESLSIERLLGAADTLEALVEALSERQSERAAENALMLKVASVRLVHFANALKMHRNVNEALAALS